MFRPASYNVAGIYTLTAKAYGFVSTDTIVIMPPAGVSPTMNYAAKEGNASKIYFENTGARAGAPVVTDIVSFPSTSSRVSANVKLPDNLPCGKQYRIRVVSSTGRPTSKGCDQAVYLQLEKQPAQPLLIHVYNTSGRIVHSLLMKDKQTVMDLGHMPKGLYYVQVSGREKQKPVLISIQ